MASNFLRNLAAGRVRAAHDYNTFDEDEIEEYRRQQALQELANRVNVETSEETFRNPTFDEDISRPLFTNDEEFRDNTYYNLLENLGIDEAENYVAKRKEEKAQSQQLYNTNLNDFNNLLNQYKNKEDFSNPTISQQAMEDYARDEWLKNNTFEQSYGQAIEDEYRKVLTDDNESATDEEKAFYKDIRNVYDYIYDTQGKNKAEEFYQEALPYLKERVAQNRKEWNEKFAESHPVISSLATIAAMPVSAMEGVAQFGNFLTTGKIDENDALLTGGTKFRNQTRNKVSEMIQENGGKYLANDLRQRLIDQGYSEEQVDEAMKDVYKVGGQLGSFMYGTGMSMGDFLLSTAMGNAIGGGGAVGQGISKASEAINLGTMGASAASSSYIEGKEKGLSDNQAFLLGTISGLAEVLTEKFSIEKLFDNKALAKGEVGKFIRENIITEGSEEFWSDVINLTSEALFAGDKSDWSLRVKEYEAEGLSHEEAESKAFWTQVKDTALSFLGGALSGGIMAGVGSMQYSNTANKTVNNMGLREGVQGLIDSGLSTNEETDSYQLANRLQGKVNNNQDVSNEEIFGLWNANREAYRAELDDLTQDLSKPAQTTIKALYGENMEPQDYALAMRQYYVAGAKNEDINSIKTNVELTDIQKQEIYNLGKEEFNETGYDLRKGGERVNGENTDVILSELEEDAGQNKEGYSETADRDISEVKFGEAIPTAEIIPGGSQTIKVKPVVSGETESMKVAREELESRGLNVHFVSGLMGMEGKIAGSKEAKTSLVRGAIIGNDVYVQVDHADFTAEQIAKHEATHADIREGKIDMDDVYSRIAGRDYDKLSRDYRSAYFGSDMTDDQVLEEIICDSVAGINIFKAISTQLNKEYSPYFESISENVEKSTNQENAPPNPYIEQEGKIRELENQAKALEEEPKRETEEVEKAEEENEVKMSAEPTMDSEGRKLSKGMSEYMKDSKVRDENGNLKVMYHGTETVGFKVFNSSFSDDGISFFFTDNRRMAETYSGGTSAHFLDEYVDLSNEKAVRKYFKGSDYKLQKKDGVYSIYSKEFEDIVGVESENLEEVMEQFEYDFGGKINSAVYPVYLNVTNPLIVNANGNNWNNLDSSMIENATTNEELTETRDFARYAKDNGFDGVIFNNVLDFGAHELYGAIKKPSTVVVAFESNQIKAITNENPTSNPDIRFSAEPTKDTQGNDISKGMGKYMKDSQIRNAEGNLRVMYHGTESDIAEFKPQQFGGQNGTAEGYGIYFSDDPEVTSKYGSVQLKGYLNVTHPASSLEKTIKTNDLIKLIEATAQKEATRLVEEGYDSMEEALKDTWVSNYEYTYDKPMSAVYRKIANDIIRMNSSDMDIIQEVMAGNAVRNYEQAYDFYDTLGETLGIDGFVTEWTHADGKSLIVVAFYSNQFKSIDNENPTSSPEIKFSMEAESMLDKVSTREGDIRKFSMETFKKGGREYLAEYLAKYSGLSKADQKDILNSLEWGYSVAEEMSKNKAFTAFSNWSKTGLVRAADGTPLLEMTGLSGAPLRSVIVTNGEYPLNIDFTTVCKKRMALDVILNRLASDTNINLGELSEEDFAGINRLIREHGFEIACGLCYVDAKRYKVSKYANTFVNGDDKVEGNGKTVHTYGWNELVNSMLKRGAKASYFELSAQHVRPLGTLLSELDDKDIDFRLIDKIVKPHLKKDGTLGSATEEVRRAYLLKTDPSSRHLLDMNDIIASEGLDALKTINPELWKLVTTHGAQAAPKASMGFTAYGNDILKAKAFTKENAYKVGGVRVQSFSDYVANMFFDYMQMFADMSARELPSHAFTKEPNYVRLFGMTGQRINMSLIFKGANLTSEQSKRLEKLLKKGRKYVLEDPEFGKLVEHAGLDENGNYIYEDESFPPEEAYKLRKDPRYKNCGTIAVGLSDAHIKKLLADPQIDMVIPYHASGVSQFIKNERNLALYTDYTGSQNTRDGNGKKLKREFDWYANLKSDIQDGLDAKANADAYLEWCDENGYTPKFPQFRDDANYYKLLADFRSYDNNGKFMPQNKVTMTFPENFRDIVNESLKEHQESYYGKLDAELSDDQNSLYTEVKNFLKEKSVAKFSQEPTTNTDLAKENREIKKDLMGFYDDIHKFNNHDVKVKSTLYVRGEDVRKVTNEFAKKYSSTMDKAELRDKFKELGNYMLNGGENETAEEYAQNVKAMAVDIASDLVNSSEELIVKYPEYEDVRKHLMQGVTISDQDKADIPDFESFRKANFGNVRIKNSGSSVDTVYGELNGLYPHLFPEEITHPADQLLRMAKVAEEIKPAYGNPFEQYGYDMASIVEDVANDIIDGTTHGQMTATRKSAADKRKVETQVERGDRFKAKAQALKEKKNEELYSLKEHYKEKERRAKERRDASALRKKIEKHCKDLSAKLLKPTDKKHITERSGVRQGKDFESLRSVTAKVLSLINRESAFTYSGDGYKHAKEGDFSIPTQRTEAMQELQKAYEAIARDNNYLSDEAMTGTDGWIQDIIDFKDTPISQLNKGQLQKIYNCLVSLEKTIDSADKLLSMEKSMSDVAYDFKDETEGKKPKSYLSQGLNKFAISLLTPQAFFERMGKVGDMLFGKLRQAQNTYINNTKALRDWIKDKGIGKARLEWQNEKHTVRLGNSDVEMTTPMLMEMYVLAKRPQALDHILDGGIAFYDVQKKGKLFKKYQKQVYRGITMEQLNKAFSQLSEEQIKVADELQSYASNELSKLGNKASMDVYGYEKFNEDNYWRIRVKETELQRDNVHDKPQSPTSVANKGMTKQTVSKPNSALYVDDIFKTFLDHAVDMNSYASYLAVQEDMKRLFNYKFFEDGVKTGTFQELIEQVFGGSQGSAYWTKLMQDIANGTGRDDSFTGKLIGKFKATAVGANLRVVIQQPTAILRAGDMIKEKYLLKGMAHPLKGSKEAIEHSPIAQWKNWGYFDINTGRSLEDLVYDNPSKLKKAEEAMMKPAGTADDIAWGILWNAVKAEMKDTNPDLKVGSEEYYKAVTERFEEIIDRTQVVDGVLQRSDIMRKGDAFSKMVTSFAGEPVKQYNQLMNAIYDARQGNISKGDVVRTGIAMATAAILNATVQSLVDALRHSDRDKEFVDQWIEEMIGLKGDEKNLEEKVKHILGGNLGDSLGLFTSLPYLRDVKSAWLGYDIERADMSVVTDIIKSAETVMKALRGDGKLTIQYAITNFAADLAKWTGVPASNIKRDILSIVDTIFNRLDVTTATYEYYKFFYKVEHKDNRARYMELLYDAQKKGNMTTYDYIYKDLVAHGLDEDGIRKSLNNIEKKKEGVTKTAELTDKAFVNSTQKTSYEQTTNAITNSSVYSRASAEQQKQIKNDVYSLARGTNSNLEEGIQKANTVGISETDWILYTLARKIADQNGDKNGNYNEEEKKQAAAMVGISYDKIKAMNKK